MDCKECLHSRVCRYREDYENLYNNAISLQQSVKKEISLINRFKINVNCKDFCKGMENNTTWRDITTPYEGVKLL